MLLSLGLGLLAFGLSASLQVHVLAAKGTDTETTLSSTSSAPAVGRSFEMPDKPARLIIPSIGVDANVQSVGLSWRGTGDMSVPTNFTDVGWYNQGPLPGMPGSAVIDGHLDGKNVREAVFYNLDKLKPGDLVEVHDAKGTVFQFRVTETKTYDYNAPTTDIFSGDTSKTGLNLITCAGVWDKAHAIYDKRIVVFTELVTQP